MTKPNSKQNILKTTKPQIKKSQAQQVQQPKTQKIVQVAFSLINVTRGLLAESRFDPNLPIPFFICP